VERFEGDQGDNPTSMINLPLNGMDTAPTNIVASLEYLISDMSGIRAIMDETTARSDTSQSFRNRRMDEGPRIVGVGKALKNPLFPDIGGRTRNREVPAGNFGLAIREIFVSELSRSAREAMTEPSHTVGEVSLQGVSKAFKANEALDPERPQALQTNRVASGTERPEPPGKRAPHGARSSAEAP
jgi:hypothetical protein